MEKVELDKLTKLVDDFVTQLKKDLLVVNYKPTQTGVLPKVWDRMKNWWHNTVMGANNPDNPYVYKNKFGALGHEDDAKKESVRLTLSQYNFIKEQYNKLESELSVLNEDLETESENLKNLKLFRIIDNWASKFKKEIIKQLSGGVETEPAPKTVQSSQANADEEDKEEEESTSAPMDAPPSGGVSGANGAVAEKRRPGRPGRVRISWSKDKGWAPKLNGKLLKNAVDYIKDRALNSAKRVEFFEEAYFEEEFKRNFEAILADSEENGLDVSEWDDDDIDKWEKELINHIKENMAAIFANRHLGVFEGDITKDSTTVSNIYGITRLKVGDTVTDDNLPGDTTIKSIDYAGKTLELSKPATKTEKNVLLKGPDPKKQEEL